MGIFIPSLWVRKLSWREVDTDRVVVAELGFRWWTWSRSRGSSSILHFLPGTSSLVKRTEGQTAMWLFSVKSKNNDMKIRETDRYPCVLFLVGDFGSEIPLCSSYGEHAREKGHSSAVLLPSSHLDKRRFLTTWLPCRSQNRFLKYVLKKPCLFPPGSNPGGSTITLALPGTPGSRS